MSSGTALAPADGALRTLRAAQLATQAEFFALGVAAAALGVHVPSIKQHYALDEATLSLALLSVAGGAVLCLMFAGRVIGRFGARRTTIAAGVVLGMALSLLLSFDRLPVLVGLMMVFGAAAGLFDVAINAEGTHLEERMGRKIVSTMHGMWSLGGMAGSAAGAALLQRGVAPLAQLQLAALVCTLLAVLAALAMLPVHPKAASPGPDAGDAAPARPRGMLALLGVLAALGLLVEGAIYDWSVLYVRTDLGAAPAVAALAYSSFSAAMAVTRFGGDWLRARLAPPRLLRSSALLAAAAMAVVLLAGNVWVALVGFAVMGIGLANVVPILFVAGARVPGVAPASGIAMVSSMGYFGMVAGPPLVGAVAHVASLTWGLALVVLAALLLAWGARRI